MGSTRMKITQNKQKKNQPQNNKRVITLKRKMKSNHNCTAYRINLIHIAIKFHEDIYLMVTEVCCVLFK